MRQPIVALALAALLALAGIPAAKAQPARRCFPGAAPAIADCVEGRLASFWQANGGLPVFGYPLGPQRGEQVEGRSLQAQPFERNRLELHPKAAPPYDVQLGRLGARRSRARAAMGQLRQGRSPRRTISPPPARAIAPAFWPFWSSHGAGLDGQRGTSFAESLALFGMPLSPLQTELIEGGEYQVQWFERARFELHPENPPGARVLLGLLQRELAGRAPAALPPGGAP